MAIPLSNFPFQSVIQSEFEEVAEVLSDLSALIGIEADSAGHQLLPQLTGDSAARADQHSANFISEQMMPMLAPLGQQPLVNDAPSQMLKAQTEREQFPQQLPSAPLPVIEDKNITANYLFSLNQLQRGPTESNKAPKRKLTSRDADEREEMMRILQVDQPEDVVREDDLSPMIEAMTRELPQVVISLPGDIELRVTVDRNGKTAVMYTTPEGIVRALGKGKTLRLNRWVNGIAVRNDGSIALLP